VQQKAVISLLLLPTNSSKPFPNPQQIRIETMPYSSSRRLFLQSALAIAALSSAIGCHQQTSQTAASSQPLRLGFNLWAGFMPWQVAKEKNFFQANNLAAELIWFPVLSDQLSAFNAGKVDVIGMVTSDFLTSVNGGVKAKVISVTDISLGADAIVATPAINSVKDCVGKRASVEVGTVGHMLFLKALEQSGVSDQQVQIVNQAADAAISALIAGKTDVAYSYEPFVSQAVASGKGKVIFSSKDVPGLIPDLLVVHQEIIDQRPEAVQNLLKTWYQTLDYRQSHLDEVLPIEAKQAGVSVKDYQDLLKGFKWLTPQEALAAFQPGTTSKSLLYTAKDVTDFMIKQKLMEKQPPSFDSLIDTRYLQKIISG
jgi:NitT/TauT family transport system substrate-binding protein